MSSLNGCCCALCCRENEEQRWIIRKRKRRKTLRDPPSIARFPFKRTSPDFDLFSSKLSVCFPSVRPFLLPTSYQLYAILSLYPNLNLKHQLFLTIPQDKPTLPHSPLINSKWPLLRSSEDSERVWFSTCPSPWALVLVCHLLSFPNCLSTILCSFVDCHNPSHGIPLLVR